jgi:2-oxoglutarate/2-oxoacid ferredoxin oxidoreductase subunit alpha
MKTLWPFPDFLFDRLGPQVQHVLVPELNLGQVVREVDRAMHGRAPVEHLGRIDGSLITPEQIRDRVLQSVRAGVPA